MSPPTETRLTFLENLTIAINTVKKTYPDAQLYEVEARNLNPSVYMHKPTEITFLKAVFHVGHNATAIISTGMVWGEWNEVEYIPKPWLEDVVIPWPVAMDAEQADALLKIAGYTGGYKVITLRHPLHPDFDEPYYIFNVEGVFVFVGVDDKKVFVGDSGVMEGRGAM
ncbi:uncharacterized protein BP01DRAFT_355599 [Aspergillus saccharolyticus JOP 1030-1]|uniref:Uncharacterized protein n=1 Tax=Aspergillus saccharolyticus JOP 1030-1 TaxID=1450539 RepID=A0A318ZGC2_9EURO|nr:hypothetical protein BP01DRAFT_355599 [Aspergillus saccharolyticus JOP 1030-1]PYH46606.1 hypothetical protein BP01DRAFT_355599 [Aspergillus saccharolyticus JOP 1030-1]